MDIACPRVLHVLSILTGRPSSARLHNSSGVNTGGYSLMHENVYAMRWTANQIVRIGTHSISMTVTGLLNLL